MRSITIALFLYILCTASASPLHLKARRDGDELILRGLPSRFNLAVLRKRVNDEMKKAVIDAWNGKKTLEAEDGCWSLYSLEKPFENPALHKLFPSYRARGPYGKPHLNGPVNVPDGPVKAYIQVWRTQNPAEFEDAEEGIWEAKMAHEYLGDLIKGEGGGKRTVYLVTRDGGEAHEHQELETAERNRIHRLLEPLHNPLGNNAG